MISMTYGRGGAASSDVPLQIRASLSFRGSTDFFPTAESFGVLAQIGSGVVQLM